MHKRFSLLVAAILICDTNFSHAQNKLVSVNQVTGSANVSIPLQSVASGSITVPVALVYSANGIRPTDVENGAGMGWQLNVGGQISRIVKGLPDDIKKDNAGNTRTGWLWNTNQTAINGFTIANNGSGNCTYETSDISTITSDFGNLSDTEPDVFFVDAPGLSCKLVYDVSAGKFRTSPYQDLVIAYTTNTTTGLITSFTITNDKGVKYVFNTSESVTKIANHAGTVNYFANKYNQYRYGITYYDSWYLTSITDVTGQAVTFSYTAAPSRSGTDSVNLYIAGATTKTLQYEIQSTVTSQTLSQVGVSNTDGLSEQQLTFNWTTNSGTGGTGQTVVSSISGKGDTVNFTYSPVIYSGDATGYTRYFLRQISDSGCSSPLNYQFTYIGETLSGGNYTTILSDTIAIKYDYWGYDNHIRAGIPEVDVNPSTSGIQRYVVAAGVNPGSPYVYTIGGWAAVVDTTYVKNGSLSQIIYPQGGTTSLVYQPNDYTDSVANFVNYGSGIRIYKIIDYDGINPSNNVVQTYTYLNPNTSKSSGRPISLPAFAFTIPYSGSAVGEALWNNTTAIADRDLSEEDHTIIYGYVTKSVGNTGNTVSQYYIPATNWSSSATPACYGCSTNEWTPTTDYESRTSCTLSFNQVKNDIYAYPFVPNTNYDIERGILQKVTAYDNLGRLVSEIDYTYHRSYGTPVSIPAFRFEYNGGSSEFMAYGKYDVYVSTSELFAKVTTKVYDSQTVSQEQTTTVNYAYSSPNHKLLTQENIVNSDNTTIINNFSYTKDFNAVAGTNPNVTAIYNLQQENVNTPVETWSQLVRNDTSFTTAAKLTLFSASTVSGNTLYRPSQQYQFFSANGDPNFTPFTISSQIATRYSGYQTVPAADFTGYDYSGTLQTMDDGHHHQKTTIKDYNSQKNVLSVTNAANTDLAFNDFDSNFETPTNTFSLTEGITYVNSGHTGRGAVFNTLQTLASPTLTKNALAGNYIFSIWVNTGSIVGTVTMTIVVTVNGTNYSYPETFPVTSNKWQYFEWKFPVSVTATSISVSATVNANISIDDVLFYPETAEVNTFSYNPSTFTPTSVTNTNGISAYYSYDKWGRLQYTYDRYKDILQKNTYVTNAGEQAFQALTITSNRSSIYVDTSFILSVPLYGCATGLNNTYVWNFGDGSTIITTTSPYAPSHTYDTVKTYYPSVKVTSPVYGTQIFTVPISVTIPSPTSVPVSFSNTANTHAFADLSSVQFYQGSTLAYSFFPATSLGTVLSGSYTVKVNMTSHASSYGSIELTTPNGKYSTVVGCANYSGSGAVTYSFPVTLPLNCPGLSILEQAAACSGGGGD